MLDKIKAVTLGSIIEAIAAAVVTVKDGLAGKKTYLMIIIAVVDQFGAGQGWWEANHLREVLEGGLGLAALRAGVQK